MTNLDELYSLNPFDPRFQHAGYDGISTIEIEDGVTSLDQVGELFNLGRLSRLQYYERWHEWYNTNYRTLFRRIPSLTNGLTLIDLHEIIKINLFKMGSGYYQDTALAKRPITKSTYEPTQTWIDAHRFEVFLKLDKALDHWSVYGDGVLASYADGSVRSIDPRRYMEVKNPRDIDEVIGWVVWNLWRERPSGDNEPDTQAHRYNRIEVIWVSTDGTSTQADFEFDGNGLIGAMISGITESGITGIYRFGNKTGWYGDVADCVAHYMSGYSLLRRTINRFASPHLVMPQSSQSSTITGPDGKKQLVSRNPNVLQKSMEGRGLIWQVSPETTAQYGYLVYEPQIEAQLAALDFLGGQFHLASGVSPTITGLNLGRGESGEARKLTLGRAHQLVAEIRMAIERFLPLLFVAMGMPVEPGVEPAMACEVIWLDEPFNDVGESFVRVVEVFDREAADKNELRASAGMHELTEEQIEAMEQEAEAEMERTREIMEAQDDSSEGQSDSDGGI